MNIPFQSEVRSYWKPGHQLYKGKYSIEKELGYGGFGVTYLARDRKSQQVVIKTLNQDVQNDCHFEKLRQDFLNEAIRLAKCSHHPHIVKIIELFEEESLPCIVMEYVPGQNLAAWVEQKILAEAEAIYYIRQIAEALDAVHRQGFLHRDVKPQNIMIATDESRAALIDFGIAREYKQGNLTTHTTFISEGYSPIEQHYPTEKQAAYTDVYSLAATLYFAVTGESPANAQSRHYNLAQYETDPLIGAKQINPEISEGINTAIIQGMAVNPEARSQTIKAWLDLLPDIKIIPRINVHNQVFASTTSRQTVLINSSSQKITSSRIRRSYISLWIFYVTAFGMIIPVIDSIIHSHLYKNFIPDIFIHKKNLGYENSEYGFHLEYHQNWRLSPHKSQNFTRTVTELVSSDFDSSNGALSKIIVEVRDLEAAHSLSDVKQETVKDIQQWFTNSEIIENRKTFLGGREAYLLVYQGSDRGRVIRRMRVAKVKNHHEYALIYEADMGDYDLREKSAQQIIDSFAWLN